MSVIMTHTGRRFDVLRPDPNLIDIEDIAHHLSMLCRFTGAVNEFYSVAQHCVLASYDVPERYAMHALLHDASEAYVNDLNSPLKRTEHLTGYRFIEAGIQIAIFAKFGLLLPLPEAVHVADKRMAATEAVNFLSEVPSWVGQNGYEPWATPVRAWSQWEAKTNYLARYQELNSIRTGSLREYIAEARRFGVRKRAA